MHTDTHRILLVDGDLDESFLTQRALRKALTARSTINLVGSGDEAIAYMIGEGKFADRAKFPFPTLIIVDLEMSDGDGFDVLEFIQANPGWNVVPRVMFSASDNADDVRTAYLLGASVYHEKPVTIPAFEKLLRTIVEYWSSAEVPPVDATGRVLATNSMGRLGERYAKPAAGATMKRPGPVPRSSVSVRRS